MPYCPNCSAQIESTVSSCWNCNAQFGPNSAWRPTERPAGVFRKSSDSSGVATERAPVVSAIERGALRGVAFCIPAILFVTMMRWGQGGDIGGLVALILGLITACTGMPWNILVFIVWLMVPESMRYPHWLVGNSRDWAFLPVFLLGSVAGSVLNALIVGFFTYLKCRRRERLPPNSASQPTALGGG